ncbi:MAG: carbon storage regulator [Deltaproteobacteria bacterium]|nr:carbon storage regulator [Deltaproteobacteria bacterium]
MLILTRRPGESIYLGETIKVTVLGCKGNQVQLGLDVPEELPVYREEIYLKVQKQNRLAMASREEDLIKVTSIWKSDDSGKSRLE